MKYFPFYKRNLKVAAPIMLSQIGASIVQVVDSIMVGHCGTVSLAAVSFATAVFFIFFLFGNGIIMGATPAVGVLVAGGDKKKMAQIFQNLFVLALFSALVLLAMLVGVSFLLPFMGQDDAVLKEALPYFLIVSFSIIPNAMFFTFKQFFEGEGNTFVAMVITLGANVINIFLNYIFIFGAWGCPAMGAFGAGLATFIARLLMPIVFFIWTLARPQWRQYYSYFERNQFSWKVVKSLLAIGIPIACHMFLEMIAFSVASVMMGWISAPALAANQIANNVTTMTFMVVLGISQATTIRVSHQLGAKDYVAMRMAANASIHLCLFSNAVLGALMIIFREQIAMIFTSDPVVIEISKKILLMGALFQLSDGMQAVGAGILRGMKDVKITMYVGFVAYVVINIPASYLFAFVFGWGEVGIWAGFILGLSVAAIMFRIRYLQDFKRVELLKID